MILRCLLMLCFLGMAAPGWSVTPIVISPPIPVSSDQVEVSPLAFGSSAECPGTYDNTTNYTGTYYGQQQGAQTMDDVHTIAEGAMCSFTVGYNEPGPGFFDMTVWIYNNTMSDPLPGGLAAGPFTITNLPPGANAVTLNLGTSPLIPQSVWFAVQFSSATAGLLISEIPVVGESHDYFYEPSNGYLSFGGNPAANFFLRISANLPTPIQTTSWGTIKARYR